MADDPKSDFLAAEEIKKSNGREKAEQERIVRWVSERLELSGAAVKPKADHPHSGPQIPIHSIEEIRKPSDAQNYVKDIRSFVQEKQPKNDVQFVALAAYYYRFVAPAADRKDAITTSDLQNAARLAPRAVFMSPSTTLNNAVQQGYMDSAGRGAYRLNAVGKT